MCEWYVCECEPGRVTVGGRGMSRCVCVHVRGRVKEWVSPLKPSKARNLVEMLSLKRSR